MATLVVFLLGFIINPISVISPAYLVEKGYSEVFGASVYSGTLLVMGAAKIMVGYLHDRLGIRTSIFLAMGAFIAGVATLLLAESEWLIWVFMALEGLALPALSVIIPLYAMAVLGKENVSSYLGVWVAVLHVGVGTGVPAMNYLFDLTGTYAWAAAGAIGLAVVTLALVSASLKGGRLDTEDRSTK